MTSNATRPRWHRTHTAGLVSAGSYLVALALVRLTLGYPAFQDLGEWVYQSRVLVDIWSGSPSGVATLVSNPVPYALPQLLMGSFAIVVDATTAGWWYLVLYGALGAAAIDAFVRRHRLSPVPAALYLTAVVLLGTGFWNGFIGSQLGLVLFIGYLAAPRDLVTRWWMVMLLSLLFFSTHAFAYASWGLAAVVLAVASRRVVQFALGVAPSLGLTAWYLAASSEPTGATPSGGLVDLLAYKAYTATKFGGYQNLYVGGLGDAQVAAPLYWVGALANVLLAVAVVGVLAGAWLRSGRRRWWRSELAVIGVSLAAVALLMPRFWLGIVNPGERVANYALVIVAVPLTSVAAGRARRWVGGLAAAGLLATAVSAALIPTKATRGDGPSRVIEGERALDSLYAHRLDQFEVKARAADAVAPTLPIEWSTSILQATALP